jgi:hypothetical protein
MKNLFEPATVTEIQDRIARVRADSQRQWGKMSPSQALEHCARGLEMALGDTLPPRMFIGRILGGFVKPLALGDDKPMKRNSPTAPFLLVREEPEIGAERERLRTLVDRFAKGGAKGCTTHPHTFFGPMTPEQWAILMYKHIDHHLRQFGA